jgi:hypothetical protein
VWGNIIVGYIFINVEYKEGEIVNIDKNYREDKKTY